MNGIVRPRRLEERFPQHADTIARARQQGAPWYLQLGLGFGLLVAGSLVCAGFSELIDARLPVGLILAIGACAASWFPLPWWARPLVLGGVLVARPLLISAIEEPLPWFFAELVLFAAHRDPVNRFVAAAGALTALAWAYPEQIELLTVLALALGTATMVLRRRWADWPRDLRQPLWYGALGLLGFALVAPSVPIEAFRGPATAIVVGGAAALAGAALAMQVSESWVDRAAAVVFPLALAALTVPVPGVVVALVVAVLGFLVRSPVVWGFGVAAFAGYGAYFMYDLEWALWAKGGAMIGAGAVLIAGGLLAGRNRDRHEDR